MLRDEWSATSLSPYENFDLSLVAVRLRNDPLVAVDAKLVSTPQRLRRNHPSSGLCHMAHHPSGLLRAGGI
jgi:hypothetical protein